MKLVLACLAVSTVNAFGGSKPVPGTDIPVKFEVSKCSALFPAACREEEGCATNNGYCMLEEVLGVDTAPDFLGTWTAEDGSSMVIAEPEWIGEAMKKFGFTVGAPYEQTGTLGLFHTLIEGEETDYAALMTQDLCSGSRIHRSKWCLVGGVLVTRDSSCDSDPETDLPRCIRESIFSTWEYDEGADCMDETRIVQGTAGATAVRYCRGEYVLGTPVQCAEDQVDHFGGCISPSDLATLPQLHEWGTLSSHGDLIQSAQTSRSDVDFVLWKGQSTFADPEPKTEPGLFSTDYPYTYEGVAAHQKMTFHGVVDLCPPSRPSKWCIFGQHWVTWEDGPIFEGGSCGVEGLEVCPRGTFEDSRNWGMIVYEIEEDTSCLYGQWFDYTFAEGYGTERHCVKWD